MRYWTHTPAPADIVADAPAVSTPDAVAALADAVAALSVWRRPTPTPTADAYAVRIGAGY